MKHSSKKYVNSLLFVVLVVIIAIVAFLFLSTKPKPIAIMTLKSGVGNILRNGEKIEVLDRIELNSGDKARTLRNSSADIEWDNGTVSILDSLAFVDITLENSQMASNGTLSIGVVNDLPTFLIEFGNKLGFENKLVSDENRDFPLMCENVEIGDDLMPNNVFLQAVKDEIGYDESVGNLACSSFNLEKATNLLNFLKENGPKCIAKYEIQQNLIENLISNMVAGCSDQIMDSSEFNAQVELLKNSI